MEFRSLSKWIVIAGTVLIWTVKFWLRPVAGSEGITGFALGVAFGAYWLYTHPQFYNGKLLRFSFFSDVRLVSLFGLLLLMINEYLQLIPVFGRTFDYYDLVFSSAGLTLSSATFSKLRNRYFYQEL